MRPTRAGIGIFLLAIGLLVVGRLLGIIELYFLAAMAAGALLLAVIYTAGARINLAVGRVATPARLRAGTPARIDLVLQNQGGRRTPVLSAHDHVQGGRGASVLVAPIKNGTDARIAYRLPTHRRGQLLVGPLDLTLGDPLGLTQSTLEAAEKTALMVHPKVVVLAPISAAAGRDPTADQQPIRAIANAGNEFFALRPYVIGDELKRVNWRASARSDDLVVRQEEQPRSSRVTVILDRSSKAYNEEGFERAVSAALSALHAAFVGGDALRFATTANASFTEIRTRSELNAIDEQLALIEPVSGASLVQTVEKVTRGRAGGTLVVVTGAVSQELEPLVAKSHRSFGMAMFISCNQTGAETPDWAIPYTNDEELAARWRQAITNSQPALV